MKTVAYYEIRDVCDAIHATNLTRAQVIKTYNSYKKWYPDDKWKIICVWYEEVTWGL